MTISAIELLRTARLVPAGPVTWGTRVTCNAPAVYVIETPDPLEAAPLDPRAIAAWIGRVPSLRVDGVRPSAATLAERLASFWIPNEPVVYVGLAGTSVARRVGQFYRTPLGDPRPHAGGHWLKTLTGLETFRVWWAETDNPATAEDALLTAFAGRHGGGLVLPFANRQTAAGAKKPHGITGSTIPALNAARPALMHSPRPAPTVATNGTIAAINAALQRLACADPRGQIRAVEAARELDRMGLLKDSLQRPGLPLRNLLRDGKIEHAYQEAGRWWFIQNDGHSRRDG